MKTKVYIINTLLNPLPFQTEEHKVEIESLALFPKLLVEELQAGISLINLSMYIKL